MDQERGISAKSVEILDENGFPSSPPPAYSYLEPESESPMPAGIPFQEAPPESRIASATSILPTASRLMSAKSGLESVPGSRAVSAISTRTGTVLLVWKFQLQIRFSQKRTKMRAQIHSKSIRSALIYRTL